MFRGPILNNELMYALASMGHIESLIVCDAGFPIPDSAWRVDLAVVQDVPDLETVLSAIAQVFIAEKVSYATEMAANNAPLLEKVQRLFPNSDYEPIPHATILGDMAGQAKVIVRTGAFDPWGNIILYSGVDAPKWFDKPGVKTPAAYKPVVDRLRKK